MVTVTWLDRSELPQIFEIQIRIAIECDSKCALTRVNHVGVVAERSTRYGILPPVKTSVKNKRTVAGRILWPTSGLQRLPPNPLRVLHVLLTDQFVYEGHNLRHLGSWIQRQRLIPNDERGVSLTLAEKIIQSH